MGSNVWQKRPGGNPLPYRFRIVNEDYTGSWLAAHITGRYIMDFDWCNFLSGDKGYFVIEYDLNNLIYLITFD